MERIFGEAKRELGVGAKLDLHFIQRVPVVGKNVYGEAFPFEEPPRVWMEVFAPDAAVEEITETVYHELIHIKYPYIGEEEARRYAEEIYEEKFERDILRRAGYEV